MAFPTPEVALREDLNGDGDFDDVVLRYQDLDTGKVVNTGIITPGDFHDIDIFKDIIAFVGDGNRIRYYDLATGTVGDTGAVGSYVSIFEGVIAYRSAQGTIQYYDLASQTLTDTKVQGLQPVIYEDLIAFHASSPPTIRYYSTRSREITDTKAVGIQPALHDRRIAFMTREASVDEDLNGDGDLFMSSDPMTWKRERSPTPVRQDSFRRSTGAASSSGARTGRRRSTWRRPGPICC